MARGAGIDGSKSRESQLTQRRWLVGYNILIEVKLWTFCPSDLHHWFPLAS